MPVLIPPAPADRRSWSSLGFSGTAGPTLLDVSYTVPAPLWPGRSPRTTSRQPRASHQSALGGAPPGAGRPSRRIRTGGATPRFAATATHAVATTTISQLSSSSGPPPPARNRTSRKPAASSHTTHSGGVGRRTKYERAPHGTVAVDRPLDAHPARHRVESGQLDHRVVATLHHHRVGRRCEVPHTAVVVHRVDGDRPTRP